MQDDLIGKSLGQFEIIEEIGRGGMASVYRARQTNINRTVAIKVLPRTLLHDPSFYERFIREVDLVAHLEHPHVLPIYDYGEVDGVPYIAMRYLAGGSMAQWLRRGLPPLDKLAKPFGQIASALDYAHQEGVIHRDLKPGNILLDENDNAYLSDFGIARVLDSSLTGSAIIGTPAYMSPEQANGSPLDARADIYSLGVVLFELVTGREPYEAETPVALLLKHINEPMPSARALRPELPPAAEYVILKATAKQPDERYASAGDMAEALTNALHHPTEEDDASKPTIFDPESLLKRTPTATEYPYTPDPISRPQATPLPQRTRGHRDSAACDRRRRAGLFRPERDDGLAGGHPADGAAHQPAHLRGAGGRDRGRHRRGRLRSSRNGTPPPATPQVAALPTPFDNAMTVRRTQYTISVPATWSFTDLSGDLAMVHAWRLDDSAYVKLWLVDKSKLTPSNDFQAAMDAFDAQQVRPQTKLHFIDAETAEDGSVRRSYRADGPDEQNFPAGQTDFFYLDRGKYLVIVEMYASYQEGNDLVPTFQRVLDSLRVTQA